MVLMVNCLKKKDQLFAPGLTALASAGLWNKLSGNKPSFFSLVMLCFSLVNLAIKLKKPEEKERECSISHHIRSMFFNEQQQPANKISTICSCLINIALYKFLLIL